MKKMLVFLLYPGALLNGGTRRARRTKVSTTKFAAIFAGFTGTFVMYDPAGDKYIVYNEPKQKTVVPLFHLQNLQLISSALKPAYWTGRCIHAVQMEQDAILFPLLEPRSPGIEDPVVWYFQGARRTHRPGTDAGIYR